MKNLNYRDELISLRRRFHNNPELGFSEFETQEFIINYLKELGLNPKKIAKTGVTCLIEGNKSKPVIMLRSDMDALPINEETGLEFSSKNPGIMHACGHDGHMSMLLIIAKLLVENKDKIEGTIKLAFQPNEEEAGAYLMVEEGILENPKVDYVMGMHIWSPIESGKIGIVPGPIMASSYYMKGLITGTGGHGGAPHQANNPFDTFALIINEFNRYQSQALDATKPSIITICKAQGGEDSPIIIPEKVSFEGSVRCLHEESEQLRNSLINLVSKIGKLRNCQVELDFEYGNEVLVNDPYLTDIVKESAKNILGENNILTENVAVMLGDDFSDFSSEVPSVYFFLGTGNESKKTNYPHHNSKFNIDEDVLIYGVNIIIDSIFNLLNNHQ